jgi:hypothetical protein
VSHLCLTLSEVLVLRQNILFQELCYLHTPEVSKGASVQPSQLNLLKIWIHHIFWQSASWVTLLAVKWEPLGLSAPALMLRILVDNEEWHHCREFLANVTEFLSFSAFRSRTHGSTLRQHRGHFMSPFFQCSERTLICFNSLSKHMLGCLCCRAWPFKNGDEMVRSNYH